MNFENLGIGICKGKYLKMLPDQGDSILIGSALAFSMVNKINWANWYHYLGSISYVMYFSNSRIGIYMCMYDLCKIIIFFQIPGTCHVYMYVYIHTYILYIFILYLYKHNIRIILTQKLFTFYA